MMQSNVRKVFVLLSLGFLFCSCLKVKENLRIQKNGKGEMTLEWDLSFLKLYGEEGNNKLLIEKGLKELALGMEVISDIQLGELGFSEKGTYAKLTFSFKSLSALNEALSYIYLGDTSSVYSFFEAKERVFTRNQVPQIGAKVLERWAGLWADTLSQEEKRNFRFETELELKSSVQLVYAPVNVRIYPDQHSVSWYHAGKDLFSEKPQSVKILID